MLGRHEGDYRDRGTTAEIDLSDELKPFIIPTDFEMPPGGAICAGPTTATIRIDGCRTTRVCSNPRFSLSANRVNRITMDSPNARFGIMASGKSYEDIRQALRELGVTP